MARMMPSYCPENVPPGERALFASLAGSDETHGWIVLHSLAIASHVRQVEGEADFVVIVPGSGILVIESSPMPRSRALLMGGGDSATKCPQAVAPSSKPARRCTAFEAI